MWSGRATERGRPLTPGRAAARPVAAPQSVRSTTGRPSKIVSIEK
jgi:hypothetical protein